MDDPTDEEQSRRDVSRLDQSPTKQQVGAASIPAAGPDFVTTGEGNSMDRTDKLFELAARLGGVGVGVTRIGLVVVLLWIGGLKVFAYEDEGIVPFVANSPFMS